MKPARAAVWPGRVAVGGLVLAWAGSAFRVPFHSAVFVALCLWLLVKRRFAAAAVLLLLSPVGVMVGKTVVDYARGRACLLSTGLPGTGSHNLHPELRVGRETTGDVVSPDEWLYVLPANATLRLLLATLGHMPGAYTGPYPDRATVFAALEHAQPIPAARFLSDVVVLDGREIRLDAGVGPGLARDLGWTTDTPAELEALEPIRATLFEGRCLIVRIPELDRVHEDLLPLLTLEQRAARISLLDAERGRPFAYFAPQAGPTHRYPPVTWWRR